MMKQSLGSQDQNDAVKQLLCVAQLATRCVPRLQQAHSKRPEAERCKILDY